MTKKEKAIAFLTLASSTSEKVVEAFDLFVHPSFIHHLIYFKGDRESFKTAMIENCEAFPDKRYETLHALEDGDFVSVHGKVELGDKVYGLIHLFRFEEGLIIESWEASQEELDDMPNEYGLF